MRITTLIFLVLYLEISQEVIGEPLFINHFHKWIRPITDIFKRKPTYDKCYLEDTCRVKLQEDVSSKNCLITRKIDTQRARQFYTLTEKGSPQATTFIEGIPALNQSSQSVAFYYSLDKFESHHLTTLTAFQRGYFPTVEKVLRQNFQNADLSNPATHIAISNVASSIVKAMKSPQYFDNPSLHPSFTEVITNGRYLTDDTFVETLLAKLCPFLIRKVTKKGKVGYALAKLKQNLNKDFDIDKALTLVLNKPTTLKKAVSKGILFVLHNEVMDVIEHQKDFYEGKTGDNELLGATSPITLFVNKGGILKVIAIQLDHKPESDVLTPDPESFKWVRAKASVCSSHKQFCDGYIHLGHIHSVGAIYCTVFRRHFSTLHPLYDVFKHHCEGTTPHFALAFPSVLHPGGVFEKTHAVSYQGLELVTKLSYADRKFGQFDLPEMLKDTGMSYYHDSNIDYYPYRDDAKLIWKELKKFFKDVVNEFYEDDEAVENDGELQSFTSEMTEGGKVNFTGFPSHIKTRKELRKTLLSLIWYAMLHGIVNYGISPLFPLGCPIKMYKNKYDNDTIINLGNLENIIEFESKGNLLANFRVNRIMDYYNDVTDIRLKKIVKESYDRFHGRIQEKMEDRNKMRKKDGRLGIQFLEPKWLPSSIHI